MAQPRVPGLARTIAVLILLAQATASAAAGQVGPAPLPPPQGEGPAPASVQQTAATSNQLSGRLGDLSVTVLGLIRRPGMYGPDREMLQALVRVSNSSAVPLCTPLDATLYTTPDLHYEVGPDAVGMAPNTQALGAGQTNQGSYIFNVQAGVKPRELVLAPAADPGTHCSAPAASHEAVLPSALHLDLRDVPVNAPSGAAAESLQPNLPPGASTHGYGRPLCMYCPAPKASPEARAKHIQGDVTIDLIVSDQGEVTDARVVKGAGYGLDESALAAVRDWRFRPALGPDGLPAAVTVTVLLHFPRF